MYYGRTNTLPNIIISAHDICFSATLTVVVQLQTHICVVNIIQFCMKIESGTTMYAQFY